MATSSWSSGALHDTDANFRIYGKELSDKLQAMSGLTKTADTGQINWTTVTRAGINSDAGYEIYYLNDSIHSTSPIYFKIYYGTGAATTNHRLRIEVATGSNGSGTLTGNGSGTIQQWMIPSAGSATAYASYLCVNTGFVGLFWKTTAAFAGGFIIQRTCNADGTPNSKGCQLITNRASNNTSVYIRNWRFESTAAVYTADTAGWLGLVPQNVTDSSLQNLDKQIYATWGNFPDVRPMFGTAICVATEFSLGTTMSVAMVGSTARTYIAGGTNALGLCANNSGNYSLVMLYE